MFDLRNLCRLVLAAVLISQSTLPLVNAKTTPPDNTHGTEVWSGFRGTGNSHTTAKNLPVYWSATEGIRWIGKIDGYGQSSPVVWHNHVIVTSVKGKMKETIQVHCFDLSTGKQRWLKTFEASQQIESSNYVTRAAPTPVVDASGIYTFFESGDLIALDHKGNTRWTRSLTREYGEFKGNHGVGSSLAQTNDAIIVLIDHSGPSYLLSLDKKTGKNNWKTDRPERVSWSSPVVTHGGDQQMIITSCKGSVEAYDAKEGRQLWTVTGLTRNTVASPTVAEDRILIGSSVASSSVAIKRGGSGDVTKSHVLWSAEKGSSSFGSPLVIGDRAYYVNKAGVARCINMADGKSKWTLRLSGSCWASPVATADHIYFFTKDGATVVIDASGDEPEVESECEIPVEGIVYGVAAVDGAWLIRTGDRLVCVGTQK